MNPGAPRSPLYTIQEVSRLTGASVDRLRRWDRSGLLPSRRQAPEGGTVARPLYAFQDVIAARAAMGLLQRGITTRRVREAVESVRGWRPDLEHPLASLRVFSDAGRLVVMMDDALVEPESGQAVLALPVGPIAEAAAELGGRILEATPKRSTPADAQGWLEAGLAAEDRGEHERAEAAYQRALELEPDHPGALLNLGNMRFVGGELDRACELYRAAAEAEPDYPEAWYNLANTLDDLGHPDAAVAAYETAISQAPELADAHFNLALLWEKAGQRARARPHWERYVLLDADSESARIAQRFLATESE